METHIIEIFGNPCLWAAFWSWTIAQCTKMFCGLLKTRKLDFNYLVSTGGMPSAHSALASGMAISVGLVEGFDKPVTIVAFIVAMITMFDASTVRRAAGQQARILNDMIEELFKEHRLSEIKLKELLGHTRLEVLMGCIIGILTAILVVSKSFLGQG
ncbi:MAG: divergent PAP2 family protein [Kiritimatiellia bacterium]